jgi:uncharacterized membrane protein YcaP (DUF421 family)
MFGLAYFVSRVLTKKAVAQMSAYEIAGIMLMTTIAAEPLVTKSITKGIIGVIVIGILIYTTAKLAERNKLNKILEHSPTLLVEKGQLKKDALKTCDLS